MVNGKVFLMLHHGLKVLFFFLYVQWNSSVSAVHLRMISRAIHLQILVFDSVIQHSRQMTML